MPKYANFVFPKMINDLRYPVMGKTLDFAQLASLQNFTTEFSTLGDDYVFTRITESNRTDGSLRQVP